MTQTITIVNHGALGTSFDIIGDALQYCTRLDEDVEPLDMSLSMSGISVHEPSTTGAQASEHKCLTLKPNNFADIEVSVSCACPHAASVPTVLVLLSLGKM